MDEKNIAKQVPNYNDIVFRIIISVIAAHLIVSFGVKESFFQLLLMWDYWRSLLLSFIIAYFLIWMVYLATTRLDKRFDWIHHTIARIGLQVLAGLVLPGCIAFLLAFFYFRAFGISIFHTYYLQFDFPVVMLLLLLLNSYYLTYYLYLQWQLAENKISDVGGVQKEKQKGKEVFLVTKGAKNIPLTIESICYFFHEGEYNFVRTYEKEDFLIPQTLDEVQQQLNERQFFRANRQVLINFSACEHYEPLEFGKLELFVKPAMKEPIVISQKRAKAFKDWIAR